MNERERIRALQRIFGSGGDGVSLGIGDDAAALAVDGTLVVSVDAAVEHVHFERAWLGLDDLGYRATMAALSDLAAMGAAPLGVLGSLVLPPMVTDGELEAMARGQAAACEEVHTVMVGGNLTRGSELGIHTTVLGRAERPLRRDGAQTGDLVMRAGDVGLAAAGLARLRAGATEPGSWVQAWRRPRAHIAEGLAAAGLATAAIDVSDGLAADVGQLAEASGLCVTLDTEALVVDALREAGERAIDFVLYGGEDYALVVTAPTPIDGFIVIGRCEAGTGVWLQREGRRVQLGPTGWDHFAGP